MNFDPNQMKMAQDMMKNMKPEDMQNMMNMVNQNPDLMKNAMNFAKNNNVPNPNNYQNNTTNNINSSNTNNTDVNANDDYILQRLTKEKQKTNDLFNSQEYAMASNQYSDLLLELEESKSKLKNKKFLDDLEITIRNNNNTALSKLKNKWNDIIFNSKKILKLKNDSFKALYWLSKAYLEIKEFNLCENYCKKYIESHGKDNKISAILDSVKKNSQDMDVEEPIKDNIVEENIIKKDTLTENIKKEVNIEVKSTNNNMNSTIDSKFKEYNSKIIKKIEENKLQESDSISEDILLIKNELKEIKKKLSQKDFNLNENLNNNSNVKHDNNINLKLIVVFIIGLVIAKLFK